MKQYLLFQEDIIGEIEVTGMDMSWFYGEIMFYETKKAFQEFLYALVAEEGFEESNFSQDLFCEENWYVKGTGEKAGIAIPAVYPEKEIWFRLREVS